VAGAATELVYSFLLGAVSTFRVTIFMIGLVFGKTVSWNGQARDAHGIPWDVALQGLWPQLAFGSIVMIVAWLGSPLLVLWGLVMTLGYVVAIPFGVLLADPRAGALLKRWKLCAIPEEFAPPAEIRAVQGPA
jgi:membrane glycosyltransferase